MRQSDYATTEEAPTDMTVWYERRRSYTEAKPERELPDEDWLEEES